MSFLINGMAIPESCGYCPFKYRTMEGDECMFNARSTEYQKRPDDCPLVPVPLHGRLIDADAYESLLRGVGDRNYRREKGTIFDAIKFLHPHYAPTIIPASEEGE